MSNVSKKYISVFLNAIALIIVAFTFPNISFGASTKPGDCRSDSGEDILTSISTRYRVFEAEDCQLSGMKLRATAESCLSSDKLVWKYILVNPENNQIIQYSYNYTPTPQSGVSGDYSLDVLINSFEGSLIVLDNLPLGQYKIEWTLTINSDYSVYASQYFEIVDNTAPVPELYSFININSYTLAARDFDKGDCFDCVESTDNCSEEIYFTFSDKLPNFEDNTEKWQRQLAKYGKYFFNPETGDISTEDAYLNSEADAWIPERNSSEKIVTCKMLNKNKEGDIKVFVWDEFLQNDDKNYNNYSSQNVTFHSSLECAIVNINGVVNGINSNDPLEKMDISLIINNEERGKTITDSSGYYEFNDVNIFDQYKIEAKKDTDWLNGVSTLDIVLIQKHLLGIKKISDPFKLYAADVNKDKKVTASDILAIRKLILGSTKRFKNTSSWIGVPSNNPDLSGINTTEKIAELINAPIYNGQTTIFFTAIKIGDINQNARLIESRIDKTANLLIQDKEFESGEVFDVSISTKTLKDIFGGQFGLEFNNLELLDFSSSSGFIDNNNVNLVNNTFLVSWNSPYKIPSNDNEEILTLMFRAKSHGTLHKSLRINKTTLKPEIYQGENLDVFGIKLSFIDKKTKFQLNENIPNPFRESTTFSFVLEKNSPYKLSLFDITGKLLKQYKGVGQKGLNKFTIRKTDIISPNLKTGFPTQLIFCRLTSGNNSAVGKMMSITD